MKHENNGNCQKCEEIMSRFKGLDSELRQWFKGIQKEFPKVHTSCAGRGKVEQEACLKAKTSRASWKESAHNWNMALDLFFIDQNGKLSYDEKHYKEIEPKIPESIVWYGKKGSSFRELPHYEKKNWRILMGLGQIKLVE